MNVTSVKVRMYNTGSVGDCLLLLFYKKDTLSYKMMIDCGGWGTSKAKISPAVKDIKATCGGEIDLLVMTHQHLDHVSGFNQAREIFDQITVKDVWMSWIENKADPIAKVLKKLYGKTLVKINDTAKKGMSKLGKSNSKLPPVMGFGRRMDKKRQNMKNTMELIRFEMGYQPGTKSMKGLTNNQAVDYVRGKGNIDYRVPGHVMEMAGAEGMKFFILGPPRDKDMKYFKVREDKAEMYGAELKMKAADSEDSEEESIIFDTGINLVDEISPFSAQYQMDNTENRKFKKTYNSEEYNWRQIETDWLESAASIAMRATRLTNNTSLAMAIAFPSDRVILLPGDAQSGNWMGWHKDDVSKELENKGGKTTDQLLENTVFYKVGHHGSHNGTASRSGLEKMKHPDLVAMMPLILESVPDSWQQDGNFPAEDLYNALIDKTRGRVIRTDEGIIKAPRAKKRRTDELSSAELKKFNKGFVEGPCYMEFTIEG